MLRAGAASLQPADLAKAAVGICKSVLGAEAPSDVLETVASASTALQQGEPDDAVLTKSMQALAVALLVTTLDGVEFADKLQSTPALKIAKASLESLKKSEAARPEGQAAALRAIALVHLGRTEVEKAAKAIAEAKTLTDGTPDDKNGAAMTFRILSEVSLGRARRVTGGDRVDLDKLSTEKREQFQELQQKHVEEACEALKELAGLMHELDEWSKEAQAMLRIANIWYTGGDSAEARCFAKEAAALFRVARDSSGEGEALQLVYNTLAAEDARSAETLRAANSMVSMWKKAGERGEQARAYLAVMECLKARQDMAAMLEASDEAIQLFGSARDFSGQAAAHHSVLTAHLGVAAEHQEAIDKLVREKLVGDDISEQKAALEESWSKSMAAALREAERMVDVSFNDKGKTLRAWGLASVAEVKLAIFFKPYEALRKEVQIFRASRGANRSWEALEKEVRMEDHTEAMGMLKEAAAIFEEASDEAGYAAVISTMQAADQRAAMAEGAAETVTVMDAESKKVIDFVQRWEPQRQQQEQLQALTA
mmetsp:Transcript_69265/g.166096  ORF Transcript_69265/g.166096 Transcript_69265/m.166096 type:complete len:541 (-) Transcript_69265:7-1629(-)